MKTFKLLFTAFAMTFLFAACDNPSESDGTESSGEYRRDDSEAGAGGTSTTTTGGSENDTTKAGTTTGY